VFIRGRALAAATVCEMGRLRANSTERNVTVPNQGQTWLIWKRHQIDQQHHHSIGAWQLLVRTSVRIENKERMLS
jgi:hypothetical protein